MSVERASRCWVDIISLLNHFRVTDWFHLSNYNNYRLFDSNKMKIMARTYDEVA